MMNGKYRLSQEGRDMLREYSYSEEINEYLIKGCFDARHTLPPIGMPDYSVELPERFKSKTVNLIESDIELVPVSKLPEELFTL